MSYTCRLYISSGFNSINIPDSPALLETIAHIDCAALQILQNRDLRYIDIKVASYEQIKDADYCKIDTWYYFIDGIQMLNADTARISLYADYLTSAGGPASLHFLDGITRRVHVSTDSYGEWTEDDPLLAPARPLELVTESVGSGNVYITLIKSTLDLSAMGETGRSHEGLTYTDAVTQEEVTVPTTIVNADDTDYYLDDGTAQGQNIGGEAHTALFNAIRTRVRNGIQEAGDLGINGSITAQVVMPLGYVTVTEDTTNHIGFIQSIKGANRLQQLTTPYEYAQVGNKKILYSSFTPFGILSSSGAKCEYRAEQIYESGQTYPRVRIIGDPRTDGKPYFRYNSLNGDDSLQGFFNSAVEGTPWKQVPLVYEGAQGQILAQLSHNQRMGDLAFNTDYATADLEYNRSQAIWGAAGSAIGNIISGGVQGFSSGSDTGKVGAIVSTVVNAVGGVVGMNNLDEAYSRKFDSILAKYEHDRRNEFQQYKVASTVYSPVVQFPYSADLYRDLYNNGCIAYRYKYSQFDLTRLDKILNMYGYKVTKALEASDFTSRTKFNYVESGVSVGKLPRWWAEGVAMQLAAGVRVWHVKPDHTHYSNNPIAS